MIGIKVKIFKIEKKNQFYEENTQNLTKSRFFYVNLTRFCETMDRHTNGVKAIFFFELVEEVKTTRPFLLKKKVQKNILL